jgi:divalent metal cation (Fe/Co/Zn/Cd) transporter
MLNVPVVDPIAGLFVSGLIVKAAVELGWDSLKDLTDQNVSAKVIQQVERILSEMEGEGVRGWHQLRGRRMGPYMILDVHVVVDPKLSVSVSHQVAERVRRRVMERLPAVSEVLVHVDPADRSYQSSALDRTKDHIGDHSNPVLTSSSTHSLSSSSSCPRAVDAGDFAPLEGDEESGGRRGSVESSASSSALMRPQREVEADVRLVLQVDEFSGKVLALTHFTCHFLNGRLSVQMELVMDPRLTISEAREVARELDGRVRAAVTDVDSVDVHLELTGSHINRARPIHTAQAGDEHTHPHSHSLRGQSHEKVSPP